MLLESFGFWSEELVKMVRTVRHVLVHVILLGRYTEKDGACSEKFNSLPGGGK